jgi:hypothetical protein
MLVPFEKLDAQSRIWIYQSGKKFSEKEKISITKKTEAFLVEWTAHGNSLEAGMQLLYDQFIIIGVNENINEASGCSVDKSVNHMRELGRMLNTNLLERSKVAIKEKAQIKLVDFPEIKKMVSEKLIHPETEVFNNSIVSKKELETSWLQPAINSWMKRYF